MADTTVLLSLLRGIKKTGINVSGMMFHADRGYDSDNNAKLVMEQKMRPNIKQRKDVANTRMPFRKKASEMFDAEAYKSRGMIEGIFGAEAEAEAEAEDHRLLC